MSIITMLFKGITGVAVSMLQEALISKGYELLVDGNFGPATESVVEDFQMDNGLLVDGVVGDITAKALDIVVDVAVDAVDSVLDDLSDFISDMANNAGIPVDIIKAIAHKESRNSGFISTGVPKILFERHIFRRLLKKGGMTRTAEYASMYAEEICGDAGGYQGGGQEWDRLNEAKRWHNTIAIESCSWGRYQIMGFHWRRLGYDSPDDMMARMCESEKEHVKALIKFIVTDTRLYDAVKNRDLVAIARIYNGPNHTQNKYVEGLEKALKLFS